MTAASIASFTPAEEWAYALTQLEGQTTRATFDANLRNVWLLEVKNHTFILGVDTPRVQEWLENRLRTKVEQTLSNIRGGETKVAFVVAERPKPERPENQNGNSRPYSASLAQTIARADYQKGFFEKGGTGYSQIAHHATHFWMALLGPAFSLWQYLTSLDLRPLKVIAPNYWSPPQKFSYRELARKLNRSHPRYISGDIIECARSRELRRAGTPITEAAACCNSPRYEYLRLKKHPAGQGLICQHWNEGLLEVLHREHLVKVEVREINEQKIYIQAWRMLPLLTPRQAVRLNDDLQSAYDQWLEKYGHLFGLPDRRAWERELKALDSIAPLMPGYSQSEVDDNFKQRKRLLQFREEAHRNKHYKGGDDV